MTAPEAATGPVTRLSARQARRVALEAQGFGRRHRPRGEVTTAHLKRVVDRLGVVQIDSVNVVTRSHYLPFFSRLGPYDPARLDRLRDRGPRHLVEYWAHEASLIPPSTWPLLGFRMRRVLEEAWGNMQRVVAEHPGLVGMVLEEVGTHGPVTARELDARLSLDAPRRRDQWGWNWSAVKTALEHLFWAGQICSAGRTTQFERRYVLPERILAPEVVDRGPHGAAPMSDEDSFAALIEISARALGVGSERCLRDYFRLSPAQARSAITRLVADGVLLPVQIEGWQRPAYLHREARLPSRRTEACALLSPFDSLVWQRERTSALFGFDYRLEIYVPADRRVHGYYVLPFLLDDDLLARVDLKADRAAGVLQVRSLHWEPAAQGGRTRDAAERLAAELARLADFLGLGAVAGPDPGARVGGGVAR